MIVAEWTSSFSTGSGPPKNQPDTVSRFAHIDPLVIARRRHFAPIVLPKILCGVRASAMFEVSEDEERASSRAGVAPAVVQRLLLRRTVSSVIARYYNSAVVIRAKAEPLLRPFKGSGRIRERGSDAWFPVGISDLP